MAHAETTSGPVPLLARSTGPSERRQPELPEPTTPKFRREGGAAVEDALTLPRDASSRDRSSDVSITKVHVPLIMQAAVIGVCLFIASYLWKLDAGQNELYKLFEARDKYESRYQILLEDKLKLQIENAGLRTTSMELATAIANLRLEKGK